MAPRLLAITSEEMGFDGFCNSCLIRKEGCLMTLVSSWDLAGILRRAAALFRARGCLFGFGGESRVCLTYCV